MTITTLKAAALLAQKRGDTEVLVDLGELLAVLADAERYQWLRSDDIEVPAGQREIYVLMERLPYTEDQYNEVLTGPELDEAIDAARTKEGS